MTANTILWIYILLLLAGGLAGFLKAKSKASLIMSSAFAAALSLCALGIISQFYVSDLLLAVLLLFFASRFAKTKKFMPSGLMVVLTVATLVLRHLLN
jgi:uncharacterized membrane protein (UPF0136 family)